MAFGESSPDKIMDNCNGGLKKREWEGMEHAEHGFIKAVMSLVSGFILSVLVSSIFSPRWVILAKLWQFS